MLIEVYTKDGCPACMNAKKLLNEKSLTFVEYVVGKDITRDEVLAKFPGVRAVPIIVVDGKQVREVLQFQMLLG